MNKASLNRLLLNCLFAVVWPIYCKAPIIKGFHQNPFLLPPNAYHNDIMDNSPTHSFQLISPFLQQAPSPFLSPFPQLRKISDDISDLISFKLQAEPHSIIFPYAQPLSPTHSSQFLYHAFVPENHEAEPKLEEEEAISPAHSLRCDMPSTRFHQPKEQQQPPFLLLSPQDAKPSVKNLVEFLLEHSQLREDLLTLQAKRFIEIGTEAQQIFIVLASKFRKLKKTKEELTKYCMRKAFKYASEKEKREGSGRGLQSSMRRYFAQENDAEQFSVPFKKSSAQKTMNSNFLKRVFGCSRFAADYRQFLGQFGLLLKEDNERKVVYLVSMIEQAIKQKKLAKIQTIRRLPWTNQILQRTKDLAFSLPEEGNGRRPKRTQ